MNENRTLSSTALSAGINSPVNTADETGQRLCRVGNTRIRVTEHFPRTGKTVVDLIGDMILADARLDG